MHLMKTENAKQMKLEDVILVALMTEVSKLDDIFWMVDVDLDSVELMLQELTLFFYGILHFSESKIE